MKKLIETIIIVFAAAALAAVVFYSKGYWSGKPVVKIGVNYPLSGDWGEVGKNMKGAIELAQDDLSKKDLKYRYKFVIKDNELDAKKARAINKKLIADKVDAIVSVTSPIGMVTAPVAEKNRVIHMSSCASDDRVAYGLYNFVNCTQPKKHVDKLIEKILADKYENVVILASEDHKMSALSERLQQGLAANGIKYMEVKSSPCGGDFEAIIDDVAKNNPDLYVLLQYPATVEVVLAKLKEKQNKVAVTSIGSFGVLDDMSSVEGQWFVDAAELKPENYERFVKYNGSENVFGVGNAYDSIMILVEAFEQAKTKEEAVNTLLQIKDYQGVIGNLTQDSNGIFDSEAIIKVIKDGKAIRM